MDLTWTSQSARERFENIQRIINEISEKFLPAFTPAPPAANMADTEHMQREASYLRDEAEELVRLYTAPKD